MASSCPQPQAQYAQQAAVAKDADAHYRLALWCKEHGLAAYALRHQRAVVTLEPDHRAARRALGYEHVRGRWVKGKEAKRAKGFKEIDGVTTNGRPTTRWCRGKSSDRKS